MQEIKSVRASFSQSSTYVFLGKLVRYSLQYFTQIFLINILMPLDFGLMRYVTLLVGMASLINEMGLTTAIVQKENLESEEISGSFIMSMIWGIFLYAVIFFCAPLAASFFNNPQLANFIRIGSLLIPLSSVCSVPRALLQRQLRFGTLALIEAAAALISSSVMIMLAVKGFGTWSLVVGSLVQESLSLVVFISVVKIPAFRMSALLNSKKILRTGAGLVFLRILDYLRFSAPFFVIGKIFDEKSLGLFSVSYDISLLPYVMISAVLGNVSISTFSRLQNDKARTENGFSQLTFLISLAIIPVMLSMSFLSEEILNTVCFLKSNDSWLDASSLMRWLTLMGVFSALSILPGVIWLSNKKIIPAIIWSCAMLLTTLIAIFASINNGIEAVAIALLIRAGAVFPVFVYVNYKITGIKVSTYFKSIFPSIICGLIMLVPVIIIQNTASGLSLSRHLFVLITSCVIGGIVYSFLVFRFLRTVFNPFPGLFKKI